MLTFFLSVMAAQVQFLSAGECINAAPHEYNALMLDIARSFSLQRILRCTQIMGRCAGALPWRLAAAAPPPQSRMLEKPHAHGALSCHLQTQLHGSAPHARSPA